MLLSIIPPYAKASVVNKVRYLIAVINCKKIIKSMETITVIGIVVSPILIKKGLVRGRERGGKETVFKLLKQLSI